MNSLFFIQALKKELKNAGITYKHLSFSLKMSEAGVKKILNKSDLSMNRAYEICETMGLSIQDILQTASQLEFEEKKFTSKQADFFYQNPHFFNFYMQLVYEKKPLSEIQKEKGLTEKSMFKYLKKLDQLSLLKLLPEGKVSLPNESVMRINTEGTSLENLKFHLTHDLIKKIQGLENGELFGSIFFLPPNEKEDLMLELRELINKYNKRSFSHRRRPKDKKAVTDIQTSTLMLALAPFSLFEEIPNLK